MRHDMGKRSRVYRASEVATGLLATHAELTHTSVTLAEQNVMRLIGFTFENVFRSELIKSAFIL
jgi:hypothetical protein